MIYRILDSHKEEFRISNRYRHITTVVNVVTAPEIEMLMILSEKKYEEYKKRHIKPSEYCKTEHPCRMTRVFCLGLWVWKAGRGCNRCPRLVNSAIFRDFCWFWLDKSHGRAAWSMSSTCLFSHFPGFLLVLAG